PPGSPSSGHQAHRRRHRRPRHLCPTHESNFDSEAWSRTHSHQTVVSQHAAYFDQDNEELLLPLSIFALFMINVNLSYLPVGARVAARLCL
ncbi:hypothetical protein BDZ85DRAFT_300247, partial [Elsinoe ampelina]